MQPAMTLTALTRLMRHQLSFLFTTCLLYFSKHCYKINLYCVLFADRRIFVCIFDYYGNCRIRHLYGIESEI